MSNAVLGAGEDDRGTLLVLIDGGRLYSLDREPRRPGVTGLFRAPQDACSLQPADGVAWATAMLSLPVYDATNKAWVARMEAGCVAELTLNRRTWTRLPVSLNEPIWRLAVSNSGEYIHACGKSGLSAVYSRTEQKVIARWVSHSSPPSATVFYQDQPALLIVESGGPVTKWRFSNGIEAERISWLPDKPAAFAWVSPERLLIGTEDGQLALADARTRTLLSCVATGMKNCDLLAVLQDQGKAVVSGRLQREIQVWDLADFQKRATARTNMFISAVVPLPRNSAVVVGSGDGSVGLLTLSGARMDHTETIPIIPVCSGLGISKGISKHDGDSTAATTVLLRRRTFAFTGYQAICQNLEEGSGLLVQDGRIRSGGFRNLMAVMRTWSKGRLEAVPDPVAVRFGDEWPRSKSAPFIFFSGTSEFTLSDPGLAGLRDYLLKGGTIWADSGVPGSGSPFDVAFRREIRRVLPEAGEDFAVLPADHDVFIRNYYPEIRSAPPGLDYCEEPLKVLYWRGRVAVLYSCNGYSEMWRIQVTDDGRIEPSARQSAVESCRVDALKGALRNLDRGRLVSAYKFGANVVVYLLTRSGQ